MNRTIAPGKFAKLKLRRRLADHAWDNARNATGRVVNWIMCAELKRSGINERYIVGKKKTNLIAVPSC